MSACVGPLRFELSAAGHFNMPPVAAMPLFDLDGTDVSTNLEGDNSYLVIERRSDAREPDVARIELWDAVSSGEVDGVALLVVCDAGLAADNVTTAPTLGDVEAALRTRIEAH